LINSIFISKSIDEVSELKDFCDSRNIELHASSLISFRPLPFSISDSFEVIFFSSIRAVNFFLDKESIAEGTKIACIGKATAEKLNSKGYLIDFQGKQSGEPEKVALEFKNWLGHRKVLIPHSTISKRTIATILNPNQVIEVPVYHTDFNCCKIPDCDVYIFTSPSNFESFQTCNGSPKGKLIAWGNTTRKAIEKQNLNVDLSLEKSDLKELINQLQQFL